jgi:hypothetical protein
MEVLILVALLFVLLSIPRSGNVHPDGHLTSSRVTYSAAMCLLVFSPLYTVYLIDLFGGTIDLL